MPNDATAQRETLAAEASSLILSAPLSAAHLCMAVMRKLIDSYDPLDPTWEKIDKAIKGVRWGEG